MSYPVALPRARARRRRRRRDPRDSLVVVILGNVGLALIAFLHHIYPTVAIEVVAVGVAWHMYFSWGEWRKINALAHALMILNLSAFATIVLYQFRVF